MGSPEWGGPVERWPAFRADFEAYLELPERTLPFRPRPEHLFAVFFQIARAFHSIFENIVGGSSPTARLARQSGDRSSRMTCVFTCGRFIVTWSTSPR